MISHGKQPTRKATAIIDNYQHIPVPIPKMGFGKPKMVS